MNIRENLLFNMNTTYDKYLDAPKNESNNKRTPGNRKLTLSCGVTLVMILCVASKCFGCSTVPLPYSSNIVLYSAQLFIVGMALLLSNRGAVKTRISHPVRGCWSHFFMQKRGTLLTPEKLKFLLRATSATRGPPKKK